MQRVFGIYSDSRSAHEKCNRVPKEGHGIIWGKSYVPMSLKISFVQGSQEHVSYIRSMLVDKNGLQFYSRRTHWKSFGDAKTQFCGQ